MQKLLIPLIFLISTSPLLADNLWVDTGVENIEKIIEEPGKLNRQCQVPVNLEHPYQKCLERICGKYPETIPIDNKANSMLERAQDQLDSNLYRSLEDHVHKEFLSLERRFNEGNNFLTILTKAELAELVNMSIKPRDLTEFKARGFLTNFALKEEYELYNFFKEKDGQYKFDIAAYEESYDEKQQKKYEDLKNDIVKLYNNYFMGTRSKNPDTFFRHIAGSKSTEDGVLAYIEKLEKIEEETTRNTDGLVRSQLNLANLKSIAKKRGLTTSQKIQLATFGGHQELFSHFLNHLIRNKDEKSKFLREKYQSAMTVENIEKLKKTMRKQIETGASKYKFPLSEDGQKLLKECTKSLFTQLKLAPDTNKLKKFKELTKQTINETKDFFLNDPKYSEKTKQKIEEMFSNLTVLYPRGKYELRKYFFDSLKHLKAKNLKHTGEIRKNALRDPKSIFQYIIIEGLSQQNSSLETTENSDPVKEKSVLRQNQARVDILCQTLVQQKGRHYTNSHFGTIHLGSNLVFESEDSQKSTIIHEIAHNIDYLFKYNHLSDESSKHFALAKSCLQEGHNYIPGNNSAKTNNEDFADLLSSLILQRKENKSPDCLNLMYLDENNKYSLKTIRNNPEHVHSNAIYRVLQMEKNAGNEIPKECKDALSSEGVISLGRQCSL